MLPISILFFGSQNYSLIVKNALIKAGYQITDQPHQAELIIVADYGQKIPQSLLDSVKYGGLNLHPSLLPKYRGPAPVPWAILNAETETGMTIIKMTDKIDAGPIVAQEKISIRPTDTAPLLLERCFTAGAELLIKILPDYTTGKIKPTPQPQKSPPPYARKFTKQDGFISWEKFKLSRQSPELDRKIRALFPWPGVYTVMPNQKILKLLPNQQLQIEAKNPITMKQFLAGYHHLL